MYHILTEALLPRITRAILMLLMLNACTEVNEFEQRQEWLLRNYPSRAVNMEKLENPQRFQQQIKTGLVVPEMTWDETLVALDAPPYGPKSVAKVYWCEDQLTDLCQATCKDCRAMLVSKGQIHLFTTGTRGLQVVESFPNQQWLPHRSYTPSSYQAARAILRNEFRVGMSFSDIFQLEQSKSNTTVYYCNDTQVAVSDNPCSESCVRCRIELVAAHASDPRPQRMSLFFVQQRLQRVETTAR